MSHDNTSLLMWLVHTTCSVCVALFQMHQISLAKQDQQPELCKPSAFNCLLVRQGTNSGFLKRVTNQATLSYNVPAPHTQSQASWTGMSSCLILSSITIKENRLPSTTLAAQTLNVELLVNRWLNLISSVDTIDWTMSDTAFWMQCK